MHDLKNSEAPGQTRTDDLPLTRRLLYQLSYEGITRLYDGLTLPKNF